MFPFLRELFYLLPPKPSSSSKQRQQQQPSAEAINPSAVAPAPSLPTYSAAASEVDDGITADLNTVSTTLSELDTVVTTVYDLSDALPLPAVPTHEPGGASVADVSPRATVKESKTKSKSKSFLKAVTKPFTKKGQSLMES